MGSHTYTDQGNLSDLAVEADVLRSQRAHRGLYYLVRTISVLTLDCEGDIGAAVGRHILHNDVYFNVGITDRTQHLKRYTGDIRHAADGDFGLIAGECHARDNGCLHVGVILQRYQRTRVIVET